MRKHSFYKGQLMAKERYYADARPDRAARKMSESGVERAINNEPGEMRGAMIREDRSKPSNLPQEVMMKEYPPVDYFNSYIDDSIYGIDNQMQNGVSGLKKQVRSRMF